MKTQRIFSMVGLAILAISLVVLVSACGGEPSSSDGDSTDSSDTGDTVQNTPTPDPADLFPDFIVLHPDAYDIEVSEASGTFIYLVPMMVKETTEYLLAEHEALGWEKLGNPTIMGHLATLTLKRGEDRLTVSLQDNEISESTRVQIMLIQQ